MLKQLLSISDVGKLKPGDQLSDRPELSLGKLYTIANIASGLVYAINESDQLELKIFQTGALPATQWWLYIHFDPDEVVRL